MPQPSAAPFSRLAAIRRRAVGLVAAASLLLAAASMSGCLLAAGAAAGAGTYAYVSGNATGYVEATQGEVVDAARHVLDKHDVTVTSTTTQDDGDRRVFGENPANKTVRVVVEAPEGEGDRPVRLKVRVGLVGDRNASEAIWHQIRRRAE